MANNIRIKRRASPGSSGAPSSLYQAELAWNENDDTLYIGEGDSGGGIASSIVAIAGSGNFLSLGTPAQTVTGSKTFQAATFNPAATGAPFTIGANGTGQLVSGLNADQLDGQEGSFYRDASNLNAGTLADARVAQSNVTQHEAALTILESQITDGALLARVGGNEAITGAWTFNTTLPTSTVTPSGATDLVTKTYVDGLLSGLKWKESVVAATTANITLSGTQTIDGVSVLAGERVLVKDQTTTADNGIYVCAAGAWSRASDADSWDELVSAAVFVEEGSSNADKGWTCTVDAGGTLGSTAVTWSLFTGSGGTYIAGNGLTESPAGTFNVGGTTNRISVTADAVDIDAAYVGQTSITTLGTIGTGTWQGTVIGTTYGGLGASAAAFADDSLIKKTGGNPGSFTTATAVSAAGAAGDYLDANSMVDGGTF